MTRIAIVGSGIAGNGAAYRLSRHFGVNALTIFERDARPGGHAATVAIDYDGVAVAVDTGFIVYNTLNYPHLTKLFEDLGVATETSDMSFALSLDGGALEWAGFQDRLIGGLFAQVANLASPRFHAMLAGILRFNAAAPKALRTGELDDVSLGDFLARGKYSESFRDNYILPMGAAIWSMPPQNVLEFPAESFVHFFNNHRLLHRHRPVWRTVSGGSRHYVEKLARSFGPALKLGVPVVAVRRVSDGVTVTTGDGLTRRFDAIVFACHSDETLALLEDASASEAAVLSAIRFLPNEAVLHRDPALMPQRRGAWASWNVIRASNAVENRVSLTYWMNRLQNLDPARPLFVSLNPATPPAEHLVFGRYHYAHPQYDRAALKAQKALPALQGERRSYFCGAWTAYGFHEDGLASGYAAADRLIADLAAAPAPALA